MTKNVSCLISVDVGNEVSGVSVIMLNTFSPDKTELIGFNVINGLVVDKIREYYVKYDTLVLIEDIRPYGMKVSKQVLDTVKFIGELCYRLRVELELPFELVTRNQVRKWIFDRFNGLCVDYIDGRIKYLDEYGERRNRELGEEKYRRYQKKDGGLRMASFHYVDDRIVIMAMKRLWNIPEPKPFKSNIYGFSKHSWQALAVASYWLNKPDGS